MTGEAPMMGTVAGAVALVDANNFYASCERLFDARLCGRPVVVLSNNDGCVIARSEEAKALGIGMGVPAFQVRDLCERHDVRVYSSNYTLYGDISGRLMELLSQFTPDVEIYSIDEAFLGLDDVAADKLEGRGREIKRKIEKWVGIPVSVGIAETKTLAKVANRHAKKSKKAWGVLNLAASPYREVALRRLPVEDVWGIGPAYEKRLKARGINTALDFALADRTWVRREMTVVGARIHAELNGVRCLELEAAPRPRNSVTCSRSFGEVVETLAELKQAVAQFTVRAAEKLRRHRLAASVITVFIQTSRFRTHVPQYANSATSELIYPTDLTEELLNAAHAATEGIYREGYRYKKAGVMLNDLLPSDQLTARMFGQASWERGRKVAGAVDALNRKYGRGTVRLGAVPLAGRWQMRAERRSPRYTTDWNELFTVSARG